MSRGHPVSVADQSGTISDDASADGDRLLDEAGSSGLAYVWGIRLRRARLRAGRTQVEVGREAGVSASTICRMELGRGRGLPLRTWMAVAGAVGMDLDARPADQGRSPFGVMELTRLVAVGGWQVVEDPAPRAGSASVLVFERLPTLERQFGRPGLRQASMAVALVVDVATDVQRLAGVATAVTAIMRARAPTGWNVGGVIVLRATSSNRRRLRSSRDPWVLAHPTTASRWISALTRTDVSIPSRLGVVWMSADGRRLVVPWLLTRTPRVA